MEKRQRYGPDPSVPDERNMRDQDEVRDSTILLLPTGSDSLVGVRDALARAGFPLSEASDCREAPEDRPVLVVVDLGSDRERALREHDSFLATQGWRQVPIVGLTDEDHATSDLDAAVLGIAALVSKKSPPERLVMTIRALVPAVRPAGIPSAIADLGDLGRKAEAALSGPLALASGVAYVAERLSDSLTRGELETLTRDAGVEGTRIARILADLDAIEALESGHFHEFLDESSETVDLKGLLKTIAREAVPDCEDRNARLVVVAPDGALRVTGHEDSIRSFLERLVNIALEDCDAGAQVVEVKLEPSRDRASIAFMKGPAGRDPDPGRFSEGRRVITAPPGRDLTLAVVRALVELHGGALDISYRAGGPTVFAVTLPG